MKRVNTVLISIVFLLNIILANTIALGNEQEANETNDLTSKQETLIALGIMNENSEGVIENDKQITRTEFAGAAAGFLNVNPTVVASSSYFYDVPVDAWYTNSINILTEYQIISQNDDKMFYPDSIITVDEAVKMVVCLLGYRVYADNRGGYPGGYLSMASELGLLEGMPQGTQVTNSHMTVLLYNALDVKMTEMDISGAGVTVTTNGKTILEQYKNIYEDDGVIESIYGMTAFGEPVSQRSETVIGGTRYSSDDYEKLKENFGRRVHFYYRVNEDEGINELIYIEPYYEDDVLTILSDDIEGYDSDGNLVNYRNGSKNERARLSSDFIVIRN